MAINLSGYYNRYETNPNYKNYKRILFRTERILQSAEFNELQDVVFNEIGRFTTKLMVNGEIVSGCKIDKKETESGFDVNGERLYDYTFKCGSGIVYYNTYFIDVPETTIQKHNINPNDYNDSIGIIYEEEVITENEDTDLLNPAVESKSYKSPGAARLKVTAKWKLESDLTADEQTKYIPLYQIEKGEVKVIVDPKPWIKDIKSIVAEYDRDANGNYLVDGMTLSYVTKDSDLGKFYVDIKEGTANVYGYKFTTDASHTIEVPPLVDFEVKQSEPISFNGDGFYETRHYPVRQVSRISGVKEIKELISHATSGGKDELPHQPVLQIIKVWKGSSDPNDTNNTFYTEGTDFLLDGDFIDWSPSGSEPASGEQYYVIYRYQYTETLQEGFSQNPNTNHKMGEVYTVDDDNKYKKVYIYGFVSGTTVQIDYDFVLQRRDTIFIDSDGNFGVLTGQPDEFSPEAPDIENNEKLLKLGTVKLGMNYEPKVKSDSQRVFKMSDIADILEIVQDLQYNVAKIGLSMDVRGKNPTAPLHNMFLDTFRDDSQRESIDIPDEGVYNDAIIANGNLMLDIDWYNHDIGIYVGNNQPYIQLPIINTYVYLEQPYWTRTRQIDPYIYKKPPTPAVHIYPKVFRWIDRTISRTFWRSIQTSSRVFRVFHWGWWGRNRTTNVGSEIVGRSYRRTTQYVVDKPTKIPTWARIRVWSDNEDFNSGEPVDIYIDSKKVATVNADTNGKVDYTFNVPNGVMSGTRVIKLYGRDSTAEGTTLYQAIPILRINTTTVTTYWRWVYRVDIWRWWWRDPSAQTFVMKETRPIAGVRVYFDKRPTTEVKVLLTETLAGSPNKQKTLAYTTLQPNQIVTGNAGTYFEFPFKPTLIKNTEYAFIVMCEDAEGTIQTAKMGERDKRFGKWMTKNPYMEGTFQQSSNLSAWTVYQDEDMRFQLIGAEFDNSHTFEFSTVNVQNATDLMVAGGIKVENGTSIYYNIYLLDRSTNNTFLKIGNNEPVILGDKYTGRVKVEAVLQSENGMFSPSIEPNATLSVGTVSLKSYYTSKEFEFSNESDIVDVFIDGYKPLNTDIKIEFRNTDANGNHVWEELPLISDDTRDLDGGWKEFHYRKEGVTAPSDKKTRIRITLSTTKHGFRPVVGNLRLTLQKI